MSSFPISRNSLPAPLAPQSNFGTIYEDTTSEVRTKRAVQAVFATLLAIALAGTAATIAAMIIVPLAAATGAALIVVGAIVSLVAILLLAGSSSALNRAKEKLQQEIFTDLLKENNYKFTAQKLNFFFKHGGDCTHLEINPDRVGVELGVLFDWVLDSSRPNPLTDQAAKDYVESINTDANRSRIHSASNLNYFKQAIENLNKHPQSKQTFIDYINSLLKRPEEDLISPGQIASVILACPNLVSLKPGSIIMAHREIRDACVNSKVNLDDVAGSMMSENVQKWSKNFPGMVV